MLSLLILICFPFFIQINAEFDEYFGSGTRSLSMVPPPPPKQNCVIERAFELATSVLPDQERAREAFRVMNKAFPEAIDLYKLSLVGGLEQLRNKFVEQFQNSWINARISLLYDIMSWKHNEIPYWIFTSGDVAATLTGQLLYAHYKKKNRDINGYYIAENPYRWGEKSEEQEKFEKTEHFQEAYNTVNDRLRFFFHRQENFKVEEVLAAYELCRHIYVTYHVTRDHVLWCKAFFEAELDVFEYHEELNLWNNVYHNSTDLAPNVCGIIDAMESTLKRPNGYLGATFFTTTQQFLPFLKVVGVLDPLKADGFDERATTQWRVKTAAGRLSTLTIYKYGRECNDKIQMFLNARNLGTRLDDVLKILKETFRCSEIEIY